MNDSRRRADNASFNRLAHKNADRPKPAQIATSGGACRNSRVIQHRYTNPSANHTTPSTSAVFSRLTSSQISATAPITGKTMPPNTPILRSP